MIFLQGEFVTIGSGLVDESNHYQFLFGDFVVLLDNSFNHYELDECWLSTSYQRITCKSLKTECKMWVAFEVKYSVLDKNLDIKYWAPILKSVENFNMTL